MRQAFLCTRFATQVVLRRAPAEESSVKVFTIPGPIANGDEAEKQKHLKFGRSVKGHGLGSEEFASMLDEVTYYRKAFLVFTNILGCCLPSVRDANLDNLEKRFSDDVLRIELCGPQHHHLSFVDVLGFSTAGLPISLSLTRKTNLETDPTEFQTQEDLETIRA
jgi:hypothetical protein